MSRFNHPIVAGRPPLILEPRDHVGILRRREQEFERSQEYASQHAYPSRPTPQKVQQELRQKLFTGIEDRDELLIKSVLAKRPGDFDIDKIDHRGQVPLCVAVEKAYTVAIGLLLANGAVPTRRNGSGMQAIDYAKTSEVLEQLLQPPEVKRQSTPTLPSDEVSSWPRVDAGKQALCRNSFAFTMTYGGKRVKRRYQRSVFDLIYNEKAARAEHSLETTPLATTMKEDHKKRDWYSPLDGKASNPVDLSMPPESLDDPGPVDLSELHAPPMQTKDSTLKSEEWTWIHMPSNNVSYTDNLPLSREEHLTSRCSENGQRSV